MVVKSVAIIGAGAAGAAAAVALKSEKTFDVIRVFERRGLAGGTWIYDEAPEKLPIKPGALPPEVDKPVDPPPTLPTATPHVPRVRFASTPIYRELTTNVPDIAMSFTDSKFAYGPFVPHWIPRQYIEQYLALHHCDSLDHLVFNTTVEDVVQTKRGGWRLTLREYDRINAKDRWWQESFDALIIANGHYSVPFIPHVDGLSEYSRKFTGRVEHSKTYRHPRQYTRQKVLIIGNSASGHDIMTQLRQSRVCQDPIYVSRRSRSRWDGTQPPDGIAWKPIISKYEPDGSIIFEDGTVLKDIDRVIYCTGYRASFPFWNHANGRPLWDYENDILVNNYQHTFVSDFPTLAFVGIPRVLTFRSFEYQAVAIARLWSGRTHKSLPSRTEQDQWRQQRQQLCRREHRRFHQIDWDDGETMEWFRWLFDFAGLPKLEGAGRFPPVLDARTRWFIENVKKYPDHGRDDKDQNSLTDNDWEIVSVKDSLHFV